MRPCDQLDHYEVLEISRGASREEVERAYRLALETWADDSLAGYSIFADGDVAVLRERTEVAYRVLADEESRRAYDAARAPGGELPPPRAVAPPGPEPGDGAFDELDELEEEGSDWSGARLRRQRLRRGLELDEIASVTKINPDYLERIEQERFAELPARVYVWGFVQAYSQCLGLDGASVTRSYIKRYEDGRRPARRAPSW